MSEELPTDIIDLFPNHRYRELILRASKTLENLRNRDFKAMNNYELISYKDQLVALQEDLDMIASDARLSLDMPLDNVPLPPKEREWLEAVSVRGAASAAYALLYVNEISDILRDRGEQL